MRDSLQDMLKARRINKHARNSSTFAQQLQGCVVSTAVYPRPSPSKVRSCVSTSDGTYLFDALLPWRFRQFGRQAQLILVLVCRLAISARPRRLFQKHPEIRQHVYDFSNKLVNVFATGHKINAEFERGGEGIENCFCWG